MGDKIKQLGGGLMGGGLGKLIDPLGIMNQGQGGGAGPGSGAAPAMGWPMGSAGPPMQRHEMAPAITGPLIQRGKVPPRGGLG